MTDNKKYRTFTFTSLTHGDVFAYKETHEGLMCMQEDGTWTPSWVFIDLDEVARMVLTDTAEEWDTQWG